MRGCPSCGAGVLQSTAFCPVCGMSRDLRPIEAPVAPAPAPAAGGPAPPVAQPARMARPLGVSILAVLSALGAVVLVLAGALLLLLGGVMADPAIRAQMELAAADAPADARAQADMMMFFMSILPLLGVLALVFAAVSAVLAVGMWRGRPWAWTAGIAFAILGLGSNLVALTMGDLTALAGVAIDAFLVWYYTRDGVKRWFGKAPPLADPMAAGFAPPPPT